MDVLRAALGDKKLTYYGASYGTYLGAKYAQLFPKRIRAMVLDGAVDPAENTIDSTSVQAKGFETDLRGLPRTGASGGNCPLGQRSARSQGPRPARGAGDRASGAGRAAASARGSSSRGSPRALLHVRVVGAADGAAAARSGQRWGHARVLRRADRAPQRRHLQQPGGVQHRHQLHRPAVADAIAAYDAAAKRARKGSAALRHDILYSSLPCAFWQVPPVEQAHPVTALGAPPILVVGTTHDPATPYVWAQALAEQLGAGVLVTSTATGTRPTCAERLHRGHLNPYLHAPACLTQPRAAGRLFASCRPGGARRLSSVGRAIHS